MTIVSGIWMVKKGLFEKSNDENSFDLKKLIKCIQHIQSTTDMQVDIQMSFNWRFKKK